MSIRNVVCVHGYLSHGMALSLIKRRLQKEYGFSVRLFSYRSVHGTLEENAQALWKFVDEHRADGMHFVGHSLGGVLALRLVASEAYTLPGRIVCLGSPLTGSRAAEFLHAQEWAEKIIGRSLPAGVIHNAASDWASHVCDERDVGIIAGNVPLGFGRFVANFEEDNDGTIAVSETRLDGATDHMVMPVSHKGMLVSKDVADQVGAFLKRGEFLRDFNDITNP